MKKLYILVAAVFIMVITGCTPGNGPTPLSNNADLSNLTVDSGTLTPAFAAGTTSYTVRVLNSVTLITVAATPEDVNATVAINPAQPLTLNVGENTITVTVTAQDGTTVKDYTVKVTKELLVMLSVPAGTFQRDSGAANISTVSTFLMSRNEITRAQYGVVMGGDPSDTAHSSGTSDPVQNVTWYDAVEFCNKLSIAESLTPVYTITGRSPASGYPITSATVTATWANNGYRLPTEMEWMWAAMGATSGSGYTSPTYLTGYGKLFAGSNATNAAGDNGTNVIGDYAWTLENSSLLSHPVGTKLPNELGLYDMSGNVWEWCWDWYGTYPISAVTNYRGADSGDWRVSRSGSWNLEASYAYFTYRYYLFPYVKNNDCGFRVVRGPLVED